MQLMPSALKQFRTSWTGIKLILAISAALIGMVLLLHHWKGIPIQFLTGDPLSISGDPVYTGFLSQIGVFLWAAAAGICLFSANVLPKGSDCSKIRRFLFVSGMLTLLLGLDDMFLLHEEVFPRFGIPEKAVFSGYASLLIFYLIRGYKTLLKTEYVLLGMAFVCFGGSIVLDLWEPPGIDPFLFEDSVKLVGIVSWLVYFFKTAMTAVSQSMIQPHVVLEHKRSVEIEGSYIR